MPAASIIYPHQLFAKHPAISKSRPIFLVEEPLLMGEFPTHPQKNLLHKLSIEAYKKVLEEQGYTVKHFPFKRALKTDSVFKEIAKQGYKQVHIVDTTDDWLEQRINRACTKHGIQRISYESPLFLLTKQEAKERYIKSKRHMASFYKHLRQDKGILMEDAKTPSGGRFSFDEDNRKKIPKGKWIPTDPTQPKPEASWIPHTHKEARKWLQSFLEERLHEFGPYEDAIQENHLRLWHSALSPLMNIGLLTPQEVLDATFAQHDKNPIPLASLEGFVRQIVGWREFIRAAYETDGRKMRAQNFWGHKRKLPQGFWTGKTGLPPLDDCIRKALVYGYNHHIERLMILGNFMLLSHTDPHEVYAWFMSMYIDAYDWVMVPNVYAMSQFADGGLFATKPYISGSNYIQKMSSYKKGPWSKTWDALYWNFIETHKDFFQKNHRLSMMPKLLEKMDPEKRKILLKEAKSYLDFTK